ncbi:hypothetical protein [Halorubellus salinus]|uniref:hypothetical protein n=1 Tax=Halorubellus salinus TaxID=755309 RepID=UPI001D0662FE|nr:hypothetical protein [Halorubellus salinus]
MTADLDTIRELVQEEDYRRAGRTGEKVPPSIDGWNRKVDLRRATSMKELFVSAETWEALEDSDWF